jgi:hypothetical protein
MAPEDRERTLSAIQENITRNGYHVYVVSGDMQPRFAYTIGLGPKTGKELLLAGAVLYLYEDVTQIIKQLAAKLIAGSESERYVHRVDPYGSFEFRDVDPSWTTALMLGAMDFYKKQEVDALQIVPDKAHWTVDVPDMTRAWNPNTSAAWRWLKGAWPYAVPPSSHALTDLNALRGASVTEACRWEEDYWELFAGAGPEIPDEQRRVVPLGTLLDADPSLTRILELPIGEGMWRDELSDWHVWKSTDQTGGSS